MGEADRVRATLAESADLHRLTADTSATAVVEAAAAMKAALEAGRQVLVFGNGGSATDAQHFAAELVGVFETKRRGWPVVALTADTAVVTSIANDLGFDQVYARQVEALGRSGDIAFAISTSGNSVNVNIALRKAREIGLRTIGLSGRAGGEMAGLVDLHVNVPGSSSARVQEVHRTVLHVMCQLIEGHA